MPRVECIAVGSELLSTRRLDTNSVWLAERLGEMGLNLHCKTAVGDSREDMRALFRAALERSDIILCTGGLGPTFDDFTKEVWAEVLDTPLMEDKASWEAIQAFYASRHRVPAASNRARLRAHSTSSSSRAGSSRSTASSRQTSSIRAR